MDYAKIHGANVSLKMDAQLAHHLNAQMDHANNNQKEKKDANLQLNAHYIHLIYVLIMNALEILHYVESKILVKMKLHLDALMEDVLLQKKNV